MLRDVCRKFHYVSAANYTIDSVDRRDALVHQAEIVLGGEYSSCRLLDALFGDAPTLHRRKHAAKRRIDIRRFEQHVGIGFKRANRRFFLCEVDGEAAHAQRIGHD